MRFNKLGFPIKIVIIYVFLSLQIENELVFGKTYNIHCAPQDANIPSNECRILNLKVVYPATFQYSFDYHLEKISFIDSNFQYFPNSMFADKPYNTFVNASFCGLKAINRNDFGNANALQSLYVTDNELTSASDFAYSGAHNLAILDLSGNKITELERYAFAELSKLELLKLSFNAITELTEGVFESLKSLRIISLDHNQLKAITNTAFHRNIQLQEIYLNDNKIVIVESNNFLFLTLTTLDVSNNEIFDFDFTAIKATDVNISGNQLKEVTISSEIVSLKADSNQISTVQVTSGGKLQLIQLNLSRNKLKDMANVTKISTLEQLDLSFNEVGKLNMTTFQTMKKLRVLDLEATNLSALDYGILGNELEMLDISYNNLGDIDFNILASLLKLRILRLDGNGLTKINTDLFSNLISIGLSNNNWNCTYLASIIRELNMRNVLLMVDEDSHVSNSSNIKGIGCVKSNDKNNAQQWQNPIIHPNEFDKIENAEIKNLYEKLNKLADQFNTINNSSGDKTADYLNVRIEMEAMKQNILQLQNDILSLRVEILTKSSSSSTIGNDSLNNNVRQVIQDMATLNTERFNYLSKSLDRTNQQLLDREKSDHGLSSDMTPLGTSSSHNPADDTLSNNIGSLRTVIIVGLAFCGLILILKFVYWYWQNKKYLRRTLVRSTTTINTENQTI